MLKPSLFSCLSINLCSHDSTWALLCISTTTQGSANLNNLFQLYYYTNPPRPACQDQPPSFKSELPPSFTLPPIFQQLTHKNSAMFTVLVNWSLDKLENATGKIKVGELFFDENFKTRLLRKFAWPCLLLLPPTIPNTHIRIPAWLHRGQCKATLIILYTKPLNSQNGEFVSLVNSPSSFVTPPMSIHIQCMSLQPAAAYDHNLENRTETPITLAARYSDSNWGGSVPVKVK